MSVLNIAEFISLSIVDRCECMHVDISTCLHVCQHTLMIYHHKSRDSVVMNVLMLQVAMMWPINMFDCAAKHIWGFSRTCKECI